MLVALTGVPGVGKTSVTSEAMKRVDVDFNLINYGDFMFKCAKKRDLVNHRDEMRELNKEVQKEVQKDAAEEIHKLNNESPVILDTHCTIKTPTGYLPGMPKWVLERIDPDYIVIVEADPSEILVRRMKDRNRFRDIESEELIESHQDINRAIAMSYSAISGSLVKIIKNHDGALEDAVDELKEILSEARLKMKDCENKDEW